MGIHRGEAGTVRIAHLISHAAHYNTPLYRRVAKRYDFEVWYERWPDVEFDPGFNRTIDWGGEHLRQGYQWNVVETSKLNDAFKRRKPDVLWVHGYSSPRAIYAIMLAIKHGCKVWLRGESHLQLPASLTKLTARRLSLPRLFRAVDVCLYIGSMNRAFYEHYGVPHEKLVFMPYCVDNDFWKDHPKVEREDFVLYVGKLLPEKGMDMLLSIAARNPRQHFIVAGDGPIEVGAKNITKLGFQTPEQLRSLYHRAKALLVTSHYEPWGLIVNEALCCGCPVWTMNSHAVGSVADLTADTITNWSYDQDLEAIEVALKR